MVPFGILLVDWPQFQDADQLARDLDALVPDVAMDSSLAYLEVDPQQGSRIFTAATAGSRVLPLRGGRLLFSLAYSSIAPVQMDPRLVWNEVLTRVGSNSMNLAPAYDLQRFRYVLVHSRSPFLAKIAVEALAPEAKLTSSRGEWTLLESTLPQQRLDAPEPPPPDVLPTSLRTRALALLQRARAEGVVPDAAP